MSSCLIVQHLESEGPYAIDAALHAAGIERVLVRTHLGEQIPAHIGGFDGLVVMGGPMSASSDDDFATRRQEMALLEQAVELGLPTLGICLGAQLLAVALGAPVHRGIAGPEIGWAPVRFEPDAETDPLFRNFPQEIAVLHWHSDTFELPNDAVRLASSAQYSEQAFRFADRAWGLQFHLEVDRDAVERFLEAFASDVEAAELSADDISKETERALSALEPFRDELLSRFASFVTGWGVARPRLNELADRI